MDVTLHGRDAEVVHLGLVMVDPSLRSSGLSWVLYGLTCLVLFVRRQLRPLWLSNVTQVPAIVGMVSETFSDVFPAPDPQAHCSFEHLRARARDHAPPSAGVRRRRGRRLRRGALRHHQRLYGRLRQSEEVVRRRAEAPRRRLQRFLPRAARLSARRRRAAALPARSRNRAALHDQGCSAPLAAGGPRHACEWCRSTGCCCRCCTGSARTGPGESCGPPHRRKHPDHGPVQLRGVHHPQHRLRRRGRAGKAAAVVRVRLRHRRHGRRGADGAGARRRRPADRRRHRRVRDLQSQSAAVRVHRYRRPAEGRSRRRRGPPHQSRARNRGARSRMARRDRADRATRAGPGERHRRSRGEPADLSHGAVARHCR